jgi:hypothetical protein
VSDRRRVARHHPGWPLRHDVPAILRQFHGADVERWRPAAAG